MLRFAYNSCILKKLLTGSAHHFQLQRNLSKYLLANSFETKCFVINSRDIHSKSQYPVVSGEGEDEHDYVKQLKRMEDFWIKNKADLEKLIVLRKTLFLRFRVTVREVIEPLLSEKVPRVKEKSKGENLVEKCEENERIVDYSYFLRQLKRDIKRGTLDVFFAANKFESGQEFYEICKYALDGDREAFLSSRPTEVCFIEEEISSDIKFTNPFDEEAIFGEIEKLDSRETRQYCRRMVYYLSKLISLNK